MKRGAVAAGVLLLIWPAIGQSADFRIGPTVGASLLSTSESDSHGAAISKVTFGRTVLVGLTTDLVFRGRDRVSLELLLGPYGNDAFLSCHRPNGVEACVLTSSYPASRAYVYGLEYARVFGQRKWKPWVAAAVGAKTYTFEGPLRDSETSPSLALAAGVELNRKHPLRLESRVLLVQDNPIYGFQSSKDQIELQVRVTVPVPIR